MKKTIFLGIAAVFTLAIFSCGNFAIPEAAEKKSNVVGYKDDGSPLVELSFGDQFKFRALHETLAKAGSDFYEVIFFDGGDVFRTSWREGKTARLRVTAGIDYNTGGNYAYIFAGRYDDGMLLGVGELTACNGTAGGTTVDIDTTRATFTISPLETDVNATATSTFKTTAGVVEEINLGQLKIPVFMLGPAAVAEGATFDITCTNITANVLLDQIVYTGAAAGYTSRPYAWPESVDDNPIDLDGVTITVGALNAPVAFPIAMTIDTLPNDPKGKGGLCLLSISVPVYLVTDTAGVNGQTAKTWYLKGGLNNTLVDVGYADMGQGGSVVIGSGNVLSGSGIIVGDDTTPIWVP